MEYWELRATYDDGYEVDRKIPYTGRGIWREDEETVHILEEDLMNEHEGINWYSVNYVIE